MERQMAAAPKNLLTRPNSKEIGSIMNSKKANALIRTAASMMATGRKVDRTEKESRRGLMAASTRENSTKESHSAEAPKRMRKVKRPMATGLVVNSSRVSRQKECWSTREPNS